MSGLRPPKTGFQIPGLSTFANGSENSDAVTTSSGPLTVPSDSRGSPQGDLKDSRNSTLEDSKGLAPRPYTESVLGDSRASTLEDSKGSAPKHYTESVLRDSRDSTLEDSKGSGPKHYTESVLGDSKTSAPEDSEELVPGNDGNAQEFRGLEDCSGEDEARRGATTEDVEFESDSSPLSSSDESSEPDYELLDPAEQARRLMAEDGGSDDDNHTGQALRTTNEKAPEIASKPDLLVTSDMQIEVLGAVDKIVDNIVLIRASTTGEYRVLDYGSPLCLADRSVIGAVAEPLGRVQQPYYSVLFSDSAAVAASGITSETVVYYVVSHASYVFTEPLKAFKGSDASNIHDEEVGDHEREFSDDEAEAEHKRRTKLLRQTRKSGSNDTGRGRGRRGRGAPSEGLNYDYTPLPRPTPGAVDPGTLSHSGAFPENAFTAPNAFSSALNPNTVPSNAFRTSAIDGHRLLQPFSPDNPSAFSPMYGGVYRYPQ